jgi:RNA polymerase sigma-70 factor, ECF subfamily
MTTPARSSAPAEQELLDAARRGDEDAFRRLVAPRRAELHAHCYRMLGSLEDAEDALQETLLRSWRGLPRFEGRASFRQWLYTVATNVCLNAIGRRRRRTLPTDRGVPVGPDEDPGVPEPGMWVEPYPDGRLGLGEDPAAPEARYEQREAVELAFIAALQHLPGRQRAVLILRDVLGFSAREAAASLGTTVASVNSALQRARATVAERTPEPSQQASLRSLGDERTRRLVQSYVQAWEQHDVEALVALLAEDATLAMPPYPGWWRGRDTIRAAVAQPGSPFYDPWRYLPAPRANGQLAVAAYRWHADRGTYRATGLDVLGLRGDLIAEITAFATPEVFPWFGLPAELPP